MPRLVLLRHGEVASHRGDDGAARAEVFTPFA
jgi:hypothetical protein